MYFFGRGCGATASTYDLLRIHFVFTLRPHGLKAHSIGSHLDVHEMGIIHWQRKDMGGTTETK